MQTKTKGLIIREQTVGESDKLVTALTEDFGLIKAFVRRAKTIKSQNLSATSLFAYSELSLYRSKDAFVIDNATAIEVFFDLRRDIETLSLAQYFAQLCIFLGEEEHPSPSMLRLMLNSLYLLCQGKKSHSQIKATVELRMLTLGGYMPDLTACYRCGTYESDTLTLRRAVFTVRIATETTQLSFRLQLSVPCAIFVLPIWARSFRLHSAMKICQHFAE